LVDRLKILIVLASAVSQIVLLKVMITSRAMFAAYQTKREGVNKLPPKSGVSLSIEFFVTSVNGLNRIQNTFFLSRRDAYVDVTRNLIAWAF
jgi:hypothetical protein